MKDIVAGLFFFAVGVFFLIQGLEYKIGTVSNMGPGFFPVAFSSLLIVLSVIVTIKGLRNVRR